MNYLYVSSDVLITGIFKWRFNARCLDKLNKILQEKEAREASLIREYEAEQLEELGEAARADFVKKEEPSKETITLINFVKGGTFVGRREERLREIEQVFYKFLCNFAIVLYTSNLILKFLHLKLSKIL